MVLIKLNGEEVELVSSCRYLQLQLRKLAKHYNMMKAAFLRYKKNTEKYQIEGNQEGGETNNDMQQ